VTQGCKPPQPQLVNPSRQQRWRQQQQQRQPSNNSQMGHRDQQPSPHKLFRKYGINP
jgi:hypothetical protein